MWIKHALHQMEDHFKLRQVPLKQIQSPTLHSSTHLSPFPLFTKIPMTHGPFHLNSILLTWPCCLLSTYYSLLAGQLVAVEFLGSLLRKYFLTFSVIYCFYSFLLNLTCVVRPSSLLFIVHIISFGFFPQLFSLKTKQS